MSDPVLLPDPRSHTRKTGDFISEEKKEKKPVRKGIINEKENSSAKRSILQEKADVI